MSNHDGYCAVADVSPVSRLMAHDGALSGLPNLCWIPFCVELMHGTSRDDSAMVAAFAGLSAHLVGAWLLLSPSLLRSDEFQPLSSPAGTRADGGSLPVTS